MKYYEMPTASIQILNDEDILTESKGKTNELPIIWDID